METTAKFVPGKWYIIQKPPTQETTIQDGDLRFKATWVIGMDAYHGYAAKCAKTELSPVLGHFEGIHAYVFAIDWVDGPFSSEEEALRHHHQFLGIDERYDHEISQIISNHRKRISQRESLNAKLENELLVNKGKKFSMLQVLITTLLTKIAVIIYVLGVITVFYWM